mmetsp:Transcript_56161/g.149904  ORF Transcript_56161/g.149904 Transcript_56161/m.149904 type:complete len:266 (+) Transcript_56161:676-1473(+)
MTLQSHPLLTLLQRTLRQELLTLRFNEILHVIHLLVDLPSLGLSVPVDFLLCGRQHLEGTFSLAHALGELLHPRLHRFLARLKGLTYLCLLVALVVTQDQTVGADRPPAVQAVKTEPLILMRITQHHALGLGIRVLLVQLHSGVSLEKTLRVHTLQARLAQVPTALHATFHRDAVAETTGRSFPARRRARASLLLLHPHIHDHFQHPVNLEPFSHNSGIRADRTLDAVKRGQVANVRGTQVVGTLQHHRLLVEVVTDGAPQFALH